MTPADLVTASRAIVVNLTDKAKPVVPNEELPMKVLHKC